MVFNSTPWKYSNATPSYPTPELGNRFLRIISAECDEKSDPKTPIYKMELVDLQGGAHIFPKYRLHNTSKTTGEPYPNKYTKETLLSLGRAVAGPSYDEIPNPLDIVGAVVIGAVEMDSYVKKDGTDGVAYKINSYFAAPKEWVEEFSELKIDDLILQYYEGSEDEDVMVNESGEGEE